jgi:hypothetical protein
MPAPPSRPDPAIKKYTLIPAMLVVEVSNETVTLSRIIAMRDPLPHKSARISPAIEEKFNQLASRWREETMKLSSTQQITSTFTYSALCAMGKEILPLIFRELERGAGHWFTALRAINYPENPVKPSDVGNRRKMAEAWLRWAREHGYAEA